MTRTSIDLVEQLRLLVPRCFEAERAFARASKIDDGRTFAESVNPPATAAQLAELEAHLGRPLPPSYRAFLSLWNGASFDFGGGASILGTHDHAKPHIQTVIRDKRALFAELGARNPFDLDPIPFVIGDSRNCILFEASSRGDGERDVISYYLTTEEARDRDLVALFERLITRYQEMMPKPRKAKTPKPKKPKAKPRR